MSVINTNTTALAGQNNLKRAQATMSTAMERLSSGLRVNSAKDDAAGQAIANRMESNLRANSAVARGINDGVSLVQTAEGGLDSINDILQRARELAVQASNGTLTDEDRASINTEYKLLRAEVDRIALGTEAFGQTPLAPLKTPPATIGSAPSIVDLPIEIDKLEMSGVRAFRYIPEGVTGFRLSINDNGANDDIQIFTRDGTHVAGSAIPASFDSSVPSVWGNIDQANVDSTFFSADSGFEEDAIYSTGQLNSGTSDPGTDSTTTFRGMEITYSGDSNAAGALEESISIDEVTEPLLIFVTGSGAFRFTEMSWETPVPPPPLPDSEPVKIAVSAQYGEAVDSITIDPTPSDSTSLGLEDVELDPIEKAREAMAKLQEAMNQVDGYRSQYGALVNRFESAINNLSEQSVNLSAAQSRILDTDYALESASLVRSQILQQAGTSMLAQANATPQALLSLIE